MTSQRQQNRELAERYYSLTVEEAAEVTDELLAEDFVMHDPMLPEGELRGLENVKEYYQAIASSFSNLRQEVDDIIATDDTVVVRYTTRGTHDQGEFMGIAPTGSDISTTGIDIFRVEGDRFTECWSEMNALGLMQQLGAIPEGQTEVLTD